MKCRIQPPKSSKIKTLTSLLIFLLAIGIFTIGIQSVLAVFFVDFYLSAAGVQTSFAQGNLGTATEDFHSLSMVQKPCGTLFPTAVFTRGFGLLRETGVHTG